MKETGGFLSEWPLSLVTPSLPLGGCVCVSMQGCVWALPCWLWAGNGQSTGRKTRQDPWAGPEPLGGGGSQERGLTVVVYWLCICGCEPLLGTAGEALWWPSSENSPGSPRPLSPDDVPSVTAKRGWVSAGCPSHFCAQHSRPPEACK